MFRRRQGRTKRRRGDQEVVRQLSVDLSIDPRILREHHRVDLKRWEEIEGEFPLLKAHTEDQLNERNGWLRWLFRK